MVNDQSNLQELDGFNVFDVTQDPNTLSNKHKKSDPEGQVSIFQLFKFCSVVDFFLIIFGLIGNISNGIFYPMLVVLMGDMMDCFNPYTKSNGVDPSTLPIETQIAINDLMIHEIDEEVMKVVKKLAWFCLGTFLGGLLKSGAFHLLSERQGIKIRRFYFKSLLRQDRNWYDFYESGELSSRVASDVKLVQEGIGNKVGQICETTATFVTGYIIGFVKCWDLALVLISMLPVIMFGIGFVGKVTAITQSKQQSYYCKAGALAETVIGNIRTVKSLEQESSFEKTYSDNILSTKKYGVIRSVVTGFGFGFIFMFLLGANALGMWYGLVIMEGKGGSKNVTTGTLLTVFMSAMTASQSLSALTVPIGCVSTAKSVAYRIYKIIERIPDIDSLSSCGLKPQFCDGNIEFRLVQFAYPTRPDKQILCGLNLEINKGKTIALVGASGCGKSTVVQLIERFYDPTCGEILLDGKDIKDLNIQWLRSQIGMVGQEPVLFSMSIEDNIKLGCDENDVNQQRLDEVCKIANCYDFIKELPEGYNTMVGDKGASLSGGQKQRIAIARALIRNPKILLLDEATSALDSESEKIVQQALEKASKGRTTIVIAHRLSTIQNADEVCVFHQGEIIESGTHQELMKLEGTYYGLVKRQSMEEEVDLEKVEEYHKKIQDVNGIDNNTKNCLFAKHIDEFEDEYGINKYKEYEKKEENERKESEKRIFLKVIGENIKHEWYHIIPGLIGAVGVGITHPLFIWQLITLCKVLSKIAAPESITQEIKDDVFNGCMNIVGIAVGAFVVNSLNLSQFGVSSLKLVIRKRIEMFLSIVKQEIGWFDRKRNGVGLLSTQLASHPNSISGLSAERLGDLLRVIASMTCGFAISMTYDYRMALCVLCLFPIGMFFGIMDAKLNKNAQSPTEKAYDKSNNILVQSVESIKTVQNLCKEQHFFSQFELELKNPLKNIWLWTPFLAFVSALPLSIPFGGQAFGWVIGLILIKNDVVTEQPTLDFVGDFLGTYIDLLVAMLSMVMVMQNLILVGSIMPDIGRSISSSKNVKRIIERTPCESNPSPKIFCVGSSEIEFNNVYFRYPTRINNQVLKGISFKAEQGKTIALVGASGCGKSTVVQLIERFYDPTCGEILLDGKDIKDLNIQWLRSQIGMVGQEPVLFNESIMDNIKRGIPKGMEVTNEQIYEVCKMANAHDFISSMPEGYNTMVGDGGSQMSGGQKQRIAIARALIRNPKILLLDEATSALDSESEKIVQQALEKAAKGRTTIIIAHRLSTIQNADKIYVITRGKITEKGTHQELMELKGFYYTLAKQQFGTMV